VKEYPIARYVDLDPELIEIKDSNDAVVFNVNYVNMTYIMGAVLVDYSVFKQ